jgi:hypothetical protein
MSHLRHFTPAFLSRAAACTGAMAVPQLPCGGAEWAVVHFCTLFPPKAAFHLESRGPLA